MAYNQDFFGRFYDDALDRPAVPPQPQPAIIAYYPDFDTAIAATNALAADYAHEFQALVDSLRDEYGPDAEREAAQAFEQVRGIVVDVRWFAPADATEDAR